MNSRSKKWLLVAAALAALGYLVYRSSGSLGLAGFSGTKLWLAIKGVNPVLLSAALLLIYGCYALRALRWQVFQRNIGKSNFLDIYKMTLAGFAAVNILSRVGEPIRPLLLARKAKHPVADIFGIWVLERLFDTASFAIILAIGLLVFNPRVEIGADEIHDRDSEVRWRTSCTWGGGRDNTACFSATARHVSDSVSHGSMDLVSGLAIECRENDLGLHSRNPNGEIVVRFIRRGILLGASLVSRTHRLRLWYVRVSAEAWQDFA